MSSVFVARWILLGILFFTDASVGSAQNGDGLLGIPWGTRLDQVEGHYELSPADSDSVSTRYTSNILSVSGVKVQECFLEFRRQAFAGAGVLTRGPVHTHRLLARLFQVFGNGKEKTVRGYQWLSESTHVFYDEDSEGDGYVYWYSRALFAAGSPERPANREHPPQPHDSR